MKCILLTAQKLEKGHGDGNEDDEGSRSQQRRQLGLSRQLLVQKVDSDTSGIRWERMNGVVDSSLHVFTTTMQQVATTRPPQALCEACSKSFKLTDERQVGIRKPPHQIFSVRYHYQRLGLSTTAHFLEVEPSFFDKELPSNRISEYIYTCLR